MKEPAIEKVDLPPEEATLEDSSEGNLLITGGSPMVIDEVLREERGVKRPREAQDEDDEPLVFKHMKNNNIGDVLMTSEDREESVQRKDWGMEGPLDLYA